MLVGLGDLGFHILQFLARTPGVSKVVVADVDEVNGILKVNNAIEGAASQGFYPDIRFLKIDLLDVDATAEALKEVNPEVLCNTATLQTWWVMYQLPEDVSKKILEAGLGPWIPIHLTLTYKLMRAVKKSGIDTHVISTPFPDAVNPILGKVGLAPTVGGGNIAIQIPRIKKIVSEKLNVSMRNVSVFMIGHHAMTISKMRCPFWVKILVGDKNISDQFPLDKLRELLLPYQAYPRTSAYDKRWTGPPPQQHVASCMVRNLLAIYFDTGELLHAPGPAGLPGGYPVRLSVKGAEVVLPEQLTLEEAIRINEEAQKWDGIEKIKDDGTVVFTEKSTNIMRKMLGYDCEELKLEENEERSKELRSLFNKLAEKYR
jgi:hypothetical protein